MLACLNECAGTRCPEPAAASGDRRGLSQENLAVDAGVDRTLRKPASGGPFGKSHCCRARSPMPIALLTLALRSSSYCTGSRGASAQSRCLAGGDRADNWNLHVYGSRALSL